MNRYKFRFNFYPLFFVLLCCLNTLVSAQNIYVAMQGREPVRIGNKFLYLRDTTHNLTLDRVLKSSAWKPTKEEIPNFDVTKDVVWGKLKLTCTQNAHWYLGLEPSSFNKITFYQKRGNSQWAAVSEGNTVPVADKEIAVNEIFLKLDLQPGDTTLLLFRLQDYYPMQLNFSIGQARSFMEFLQDLNLYNGLCYGVMLMMMIYNLYLFFTQKGKVYIYYVLYILGNGIFTLVFNGNFMYLPNFMKIPVLFDPIIFPASFGVFLTLFTIELFKGFLPKSLLKILYVFIWVVASDVLIALVDIHVAFNIIRVLGLLLGIVSIAAGIIAYRNGSPSAKFYIIGFGAYLGSLIYIILSGPLFPISSFALKSVVTGGALESVFLSFAQGDKLKFLEAEKQKAQHEALLQLRENEKLIREQNVVLEQKVQERTAELAEKNKEVTDSIQYAKRIQTTLLGDTELLRLHFPEHFIIYKPKDIVSGDFYWMAAPPTPEGGIKVPISPIPIAIGTGIPPSVGGGALFIAVCDSTGHGVPGAFMSLLNISFLNEAIVERNITDPSDAFNYIRTHLIQSISRDGGRDGMDGILLAITPETDGNSYSCAYVAANNNPVLIRENNITVLPADKMPVGQWEKMNSFTLHKITVKKGDLLYLCTDGFGDQFGGPNGKKFKHKQLNEVLLAISNKPMEEQKRELEQTFDKWKGNLEQVDDVCIIGIRI